MSTKQDSKQVRYLQRNKLDQESKIIGNYYRDVIRQFGVDVIYHKLDTKNFENFSGIVDRNNILRHAYGYEIDPDYSISANMISYMEVENDVFNLQKFGIIPNMDVNFYFDSNDFACALATKLGQYKEYKIQETEIDLEVPEFNAQTSATLFPFNIGSDYIQFYFSETLSGRFFTQLSGYELNKEYTLQCYSYENEGMQIKNASNPYLYRSQSHEINQDEMLDAQVFITFKVSAVQYYDGKVKYILHGKVHGNVLFYDVHEIGKYMDKIHPQVGDLITIDFPNEQNREQFEITECIDKQLTPDGFSPLLHKYIWKCKARRYVNSYEEMEQNDANERVEEAFKYDTAVKEKIVEDISHYPDNEDDAYGGYSNISAEHEYDAMHPNPDKKYEMETFEQDSCIQIMQFETGCKLVTNGYDLYFIDSKNIAYKVTCESQKIEFPVSTQAGLRYLKSTDNELVFVNIEGTAFTIIFDEKVIGHSLEMCLNSLYDITLDAGNINQDGNNFYKFKESKTIIWTADDNLFCRLGSGLVVKIV